MPAAQCRELLNVTVSAQSGFASPNEALLAWVAAVESLGVLVFQMSRVSPDECRGFSIYEDVLPVSRPERCRRLRRPSAHSPPRACASDQQNERHL